MGVGETFPQMLVEMSTCESAQRSEGHANAHPKLPV